MQNELPKKKLVEKNDSMVNFKDFTNKFPKISLQWQIILRRLVLVSNYGRIKIKIDEITHIFAVNATNLLHSFVALMCILDA